MILVGIWLWSEGTAPLVSVLDQASAALHGPLVVPPPSAAAVALADAAHFSDEGRRIFYATRPQVLDEAAFAGRCDDVGSAHALAASGFVGCYLPGTDSIVVYQPADPRIAGQAVTTAAHETLHAAWERLSPAEQKDLTPLLEAAATAVPAKDEIHAQIAGSVGTHPESRPTELFAYLGTQVAGLDPRLEQVYARYFTDRAALVGVYTAVHGGIVRMAAEITAANTALLASETANAQARAQLTADTESRDAYRKLYESKAAEVAAMSPGERSRLRLSWVWWDGTDLPMAAADKTLATAAGLLARDDAALSARDATITAAESAAATEQARVQGLVDDLTALNEQMDASA